MIVNRLSLYSCCLCLFCGNIIAAESASPALQGLEAQIAKDLKILNYPGMPWNPPINGVEDILDVAIVGGGFSGMAVAFGLKREGIHNIQIFDENVKGEEGPWVTYARMRVLRSDKTDVGPALGIPSLTFHSWYEAQYGTDSWDTLNAVPTTMWMDYLNWYRDILDLPIKNEYRLLSILPNGNNVELVFASGEKKISVIARKVVLATGRKGFGSAEKPDFMEGVPESLYSYTSEMIDLDKFKGKRVGVVGAGASAFDAAATALEHGAVSVDMIVRRGTVPSLNKFAKFFHTGFMHGFYALSDEDRWQLFNYVSSYGTPPPIDVLHRVSGYPNLHFHPHTSIKSAHEEDGELILETNEGALTYDFLVLGTGFVVDTSQRPELSVIQEDILLWKDKLPQELSQQFPKTALFPYLGPNFELLEKEKGKSPCLNHIYCFNYGATLSHGMVSSNIEGIPYGVHRLVEGVVTAIFIEDLAWHKQQIEDYEDPSFNVEDYDYLPREALDTSR